MSGPRWWFGRAHSAKLHRAACLRVRQLETRQLLSGNPPGLLIIVAPGDSIQHAINSAHAGDVILIEPGTYKEALTVSTPRLSLIGLTDSNGTGVVLASPGGDAAVGITVADHNGGILHGFTLEHITVRGFAADGVLLTGVDGFRLEDVITKNDAEYGLFPVFSSHGVIEGCSASGSNDTGIYIGQSAHVLVSGNQAFNNVNGIEIENSSYVRTTANLCYHNTVGILEDLLPGLAIEVSSHNVIDNNLVMNNNRRNTAPADDLAASEVRGMGIFVIGGDHQIVRSNIVTGNGYAGIVLISGTTLLQLAGLNQDSYGNTDPNPEATRIVDNVLYHNGLMFSYQALPPGGDLLWDGTGLNNHWRHNVYSTSDPPLLP